MFSSQKRHTCPFDRRVLLVMAAFFLMGGLAQATTIKTDTLAIGAGDPTQLGRLFRDTVISDWSAPKPFPGVTTATTTYHYTTLDLDISALESVMVARRAWPPGAIGSAVVAPEGGGRIAYVLYDRLKDAATAAGWQEQELLAVVIAHELAHLLLPPGSHSSDGLMRKGWDVAELRQFHASSLAFTPEQTALIRARLGQVVAAR